ncbi:uncharacterized protein TM35_000031330 [Trypanosoma theileri]|uniref:DUF4378 domain-containing protein n=1 Tax=Trypanosoma theileri TaxID=67003 RepID=A0A1X0P7H3_9TRYP|nr:uncharacterized protein TM35_000031330 [Trypanosoma theileri]ORC92380.1 hypothetical protein TM35_000031330 [Trypanosoma theileri]
MAAHGVVPEVREDSRSESINGKAFHNDLIKLDIMREFLEKSREKAAQHHEDRISLLESQYLLRLQKSSKLHTPSLDHRLAVGVETQNGSIESPPKSSTSNNTSAITANVSVVEIELDESDEEEPPEKKHAMLWRQQQHQKHSNTLSSSPQSRTDSDGISPEMCTPFSPQAVTSSRSPTTSLEEVHIMKYGNSKNNKTNNNNKNNKNGGSCSVEETPVVNPNKTPLSGKIDKVDMNISNSSENMVSRLSYRSYQTTQDEMIFNSEEEEEKEKEQNVTRSLMQSFGNHINELTPQKSSNTPPLLSTPLLLSHSVDPQIEPELQEFLLWQSEKSVKRRESLQMANNNRSKVAKVYAAASTELRWPSLFDDSSKKTPVKPPLTPESSPSRFISWIADEVDCYEDLLLHLTPTAEEVERWVVDAVVDVVINKFTTECVVDFILQQQ